jgi:hypothetical protein
MSTAPGAGGSPDTARPYQRIGAIEVKQLLFVAIAGVAGGVLFWLLGAWSDQPAFSGWPVYGQILALMFIGSMAALFGVYLLTASNLNAMRTYVFAIVCGLVWQPIINSARQSVISASASRQASVVSNQADQLKNAAEHGDQQQINNAVTTTVPAVTKAITGLADVQNADKKQQVVDSSKAAIGALEDASAKAPQPSIEGIQNIGITASQANQTVVGIHAIQALHSIATHTRQADVLKQSQDSISAIAQNSKDPALRKAAEVSLRDIMTQRSK